MQKRVLIISACILVAAFIVVAALVFKINKMNKEAERVRIEQATVAFRDSIADARAMRAAEEEAYRLRDSARNAAIDQLNKVNKQKNDEINRVRGRIAGAPDPFLDSLWTAEWGKVDGPLW